MLFGVSEAALFFVFKVGFYGMGVEGERGILRDRGDAEEEKGELGLQSEYGGNGLSLGMEAAASHHRF